MNILISVIKKCDKAVREKAIGLHEYKENSYVGMPNHPLTYKMLITKPLDVGRVQLACAALEAEKLSAC